MNTSQNRYVGDQTANKEAAHASTTANGAEGLTLRSNDIQEILDKMPHWLIRWGSFLSFMTLVLALVASYLIPYPDAISVPVNLSDPLPLQAVTARTKGRISQLLAPEGAFVRAGTPLLLFGNPVQYEAIKELKVACDAFAETGRPFPFHRFQVAELGQLKWCFLRFERSQREDSAMQTIAFRQLHRDAQHWIDRFELCSPANGYVRYNSSSMLGVAVKPDDRLAEVHQHATALLVAHGKVSSIQARTMKTGQRVLVTPTDDPSETYGQVEGMLIFISAFPDANGELELQVVLPEGLRTTMGFKTPFHHPMQAKADIFTGDQRLIQRLFHHLNHLF